MDKRQRGWWPNAVRFLQLAWTKGRGAGQPKNWTEAAQDRTLWKETQQAWLWTQGLPRRGQVKDPQQVDLLGRQVLQRHVPVEEAYDAPLRIIHVDASEYASQAVQVATDGSAKDHRGGFAAVMLAPYAEIETAIVGRGSMPDPCPNILAEVRAALLGIRMALQLHKSTHVGCFELLTNSMHVQSIEDDLVAGKHAGIVSTLLQAWTELRCCSSATVKWVKGHSQHLLNELADRRAKAMLGRADRRLDYRLALTGQDLPTSAVS